MEQYLSLDKTVSIAGMLLMLDDTTPHVAVPIQAIRDGKVIATTLSDEHGDYRFISLKPGRHISQACLSTSGRHSRWLG